jgi:hypothetical protein
VQALEFETLPLVRSESRDAASSSWEPGQHKQAPTGGPPPPLPPALLSCRRLALPANAVAHRHAGRFYHALAHNLTAVVGAGVLGLPYAISSLGLATGVLALLVACVVSLYCSYLLAALHQIDGRRHNSYRALGEHILGPFWGFWAVAPFQVDPGRCCTPGAAGAWCAAWPAAPPGSVLPARHAPPLPCPPPSHPPPPPVPQKTVMVGLGVA